MIESYGKMICSSLKWPEGTTEEQKQMIYHEVEYQAKMKASICVIYNPSCGCQIDVDVILDRYPMSKKIHCNCHECGKRCLLEISNPIRFWEPLNKTEFNLEDLKKMTIPESHQSEYLCRYQRLSCIKKIKK